MKEIKDDTNRDLPCSWTERLSTVKMTILPQAVHRFTAVAVSLPRKFSQNQNKIFHTRKHQRL